MAKNHIIKQAIFLFYNLRLLNNTVENRDVQTLTPSSLTMSHFCLCISTCVSVQSVSFLPCKEHDVDVKLEPNLVIVG